MSFEDLLYVFWAPIFSRDILTIFVIGFSLCYRDRFHQWTACLPNVWAWYLSLWFPFYLPNNVFINVVTPPEATWKIKKYIPSVQIAEKTWESELIATGKVFTSLMIFLLASIRGLLSLIHIILRPPEMIWIWQPRHFRHILIPLKLWVWLEKQMGRRVKFTMIIHLL